MRPGPWSRKAESGATTLDEIIARAGGSRATIYSAFGDKDGLIETAVGESCAAFAEHMMVTLDTSKDPTTTLTRLATDVVEQVWTPEALRIFGSFLTEGERFPQVIAAFLRNGPDRLYRRLADYLTEVRDRGQAPIENPDYAAKMFLDTLHGDWLIGSLGDQPAARSQGP